MSSTEQVPTKRRKEDDKPGMKEEAKPSWSSIVDATEKTTSENPADDKISAMNTDREKSAPMHKISEDVIARYDPPMDAPYVTQKQQVQVAEWLLNQKRVDIRDLQVWEDVREVVKKKSGDDIPAMLFRWLWMHRIESTLQEILLLKFLDNLPVIDEDEPDAVKLEKCASRFNKLQEVYEQFASPPSICVYNSAGGNREYARIGHVHCVRANAPKFVQESEISFIPTNQYVARYPEERIIKQTSSKLFESLVFYLPKSICVLMEAERIKLELLIGVFGGTCTPRESDLDSKTIMLATGDPHGNLLRLKMWYQLSQYDPRMIQHCIENQKKLMTAYCKSFGGSDLGVVVMFPLLLLTGRKTTRWDFRSMKMKILWDDLNVKLFVE